MTEKQGVRTMLHVKLNIRITCIKARNSSRSVVSIRRFLPTWVLFICHDGRLLRASNLARQLFDSLKIEIGFKKYEGNNCFVASI